MTLCRMEVTEHQKTMTQFYTDPTRAYDPNALPDGEAFEMDETLADGMEENDGTRPAPGWYFWACFPGCLPDSDPTGPYESETAAIFAGQDRDKESPGRWLMYEHGDGREGRLMSANIVEETGAFVSECPPEIARRIVREHNAIVDARAVLIAALVAPEPLPAAIADARGILKWT
jgi:hypothetical protein